jgi:hypothetical protein
MELIKRYVLKDAKLKLLSLALAVLLWFAISYVGESKVSVRVPVSLNSPGETYMITAIDSEDVLVTIEGPVSTLKNMKARDIKVRIDPSNLREGKHTLNLLKGDIEVPKDIHVEQVKPDTISVEVDAVIEKKVKIVVKLDKKWTGLYRVKTWGPLYVMAEGAKGSLSDKTIIETQPVDGNFQNDEEEILMALNTKGMILKRLKPDSVKVILRRH